MQVSGLHLSAAAIDTESTAAVCVALLKCYIQLRIMEHPCCHVIGKQPSNSDCSFFRSNLLRLALLFAHASAHFYAMNELIFMLQSIGFTGETKLCVVFVVLLLLLLAHPAAMIRRRFLGLRWHIARLAASTW